MKIDCPHCAKEIPLAPMAELAKENRLTLQWEFQEGHMMTAKTLGDQLSNMERLLKAVAKDLGGKVEVFVYGMRCDYPHVSVDFFVVGHKEAKRAVIDLLATMGQEKP